MNKINRKTVTDSTLTDVQKLHRELDILQSQVNSMMNLLRYFSKPSECHNAEWSGIPDEDVILCGKCPPCRGLALIAKIEEVT